MLLIPAPEDGNRLSPRAWVMAVAVALISAWVLIGAGQSPVGDGPATLEAPPPYQEQHEEPPTSFRGRIRR